MQYFQEQKKRGGSLIVVDPRATPTAAASTLHLQITPGTDAALANGLLHIAMKEGYMDEAFIAERTRDFELVRRIASSYWPERVERITGISEQQLQPAARLLGTRENRDDPDRARTRAAKSRRRTMFWRLSIWRSRWGRRASRTAAMDV